MIDMRWFIHGPLNSVTAQLLWRGQNWRLGKFSLVRTLCMDKPWHDYSNADTVDIVVHEGLVLKLAKVLAHSLALPLQALL